MRNNISIMLYKIFKNIRKAYDYLLLLCFPDKCVYCGKKNELFCELCIAKTRHPERDLPKNVYAACDYRDPQIKNALLFLKYYKKARLGSILGKILYERLLEDISDIRIYTRGAPIILIPAPLSKKRLKERGYNQALIIALGFREAAQINIENPIFEIIDDLVIKSKDTKPQAKIKNRKERLTNLKDCFMINPKNKYDLRGRTVIVIDDITTTGSTLSEIMSVLEDSGAKKVVGFAVAH